jgi:hypothetical protein
MMAAHLADNTRMSDMSVRRFTKNFILLAVTWFPRFILEFSTCFSVILGVLDSKKVSCEDEQSLWEWRSTGKATIQENWATVCWVKRCDIIFASCHTTSERSIYQRMVLDCWCSAESARYL